MAPRTRPLTAAALALCVTLLLSGCGGDDPDADPGSDGASTGSTGTSGSSDSGEPSDTESSQPPDGAATGPEISTDSVTLNVPEGWEVRKVSGDITSASPTRGPLITISVKDFEVDTSGEEQPLDEIARSEVKAEAEATDPEILPETEIAGVPVFHIAGRVTDSLWLESFGPSVADRSVVIGYEGLALVREPKRQEIIDSVLATVEWTY